MNTEDDEDAEGGSGSDKKQQGRPRTSHDSEADDDDDEDDDGYSSANTNSTSFQRNQFHHYYNSNGGHSMPNGGSGTFNGDSPFKLPDREVDLPLTLEELNGGCVKRRKLRVAGCSDDTLPVLTICVKPGYRPGDRVRFRAAWTPPGSPVAVDVVFVISQKPHSIFRLEGDDLRLTMRLNLVDALTGALLVVRTIDNTPLNLLLEPVISPTHTERVPAHGMPRRSDPTQRGDLLVSFDIVFPQSVDADFRPMLRELFKKFDGDKEKEREKDKDSSTASTSSKSGTKRNIRRSSSVFVSKNPSGNTNGGGTNTQNGQKAHQSHGRQPNSFHQTQQQARHQSTSNQPQTQSTTSNQKHHRRASATHDAASDFSRMSDRRDDSSQHSQQPHSKSRRRFANIFR